MTKTPPLYEAMQDPVPAERFTSTQVCNLVLEQALPLSPFHEGSSDRRDAVYGLVRPVDLERMAVDVRGHRLLNSDQTNQLGGSYKLRGSTHALLAALDADPALTDVHIASAGNAANGALQACLALGQRLGRALRLGAECTTGASETKMGILQYGGATVNNRHARFVDAREAARVLGEQPGHVTLDAYDAVETIAGQATVGWETLFDLVGQASVGRIDLHHTPIKLFVPVGGGGLISGIASVMFWAKEQGLIGQNVQVIGVQMQGCDAMKRYRDYVLSGELPPADLFADGLRFSGKADGTAVETPGELTRAVCSDPNFVADIVTVSEGELGLAMANATRCHGYEIEPAGALSLAGACLYAGEHPAQPRAGAPSETLITFTTGANVAPDLYEYFMLAAAGLLESRRLAGAAALDAYRDVLNGFANVGLSRHRGRPDGGAPARRARSAGSKVWSSPVGRQ